MADTYPKFKTEHFQLFGGINSKPSLYLNGPHEFRDIVNMNFLYPGALNKRPGSTMYAGSTVSGRITGIADFQRLNGASYIVMTANTNLYTVSPPNTITPIITNLLNNATFDFVVFADRLFGANGKDSIKFDGVNSYKYSLPPGATASWGVTQAIGGSMTAGVTGTFVFAYGYVNERAYVGPVSNAFTLTINGATFNSVTYYGMTLDQLGYGITALQLWRTSNGGVDLYGTTLAVSGATQILDLGFPLGTSLAIPHLWVTMAPRFQEIYNNQYFIAGFSSMLSRLYWSEIGEPEAVQPTFYAEFRTNDGDRLTGLKAYNAGMMVTKTNSMHRLIGDNPSNFALQEISTDYGGLSHQAMVTFENLFWCLDSKGIVQYNGAQVGIISEAMEPIFLRMNIAAAIDNATAVHFKQSNEVWFSFPIDGATLNNTIVAYDYITKAWNRYDGIVPSYMAVGQGVQKNKTVFYGGYTGALSFVSATFMGDNGNDITCSVFTRWLAVAGQTTENMYRRFWLDVDPIIGITQPINLLFFTNYATTIQSTGTIYQNPFQTRIDFGLSSRSIAAQMFHTSSTLPFKINAYAFESRYQRSV